MKINIRFFIDKSKINKIGKCPLNCRITFNKQRKQFSTGLFINPCRWNSKQQSAKPPPDSYRDDENDIINTQLSLIKNKIHQAFLMLQIQVGSFDVHDIYSLYKGEHLPKETGTVEFFKKFLRKMERLVGLEIKKATLKKYEKVCDHIADFIKWKFKKNDILLTSIKSSFLADLDYYLKTEKHHSKLP